jgi:hypothetical protein
MPEQITDVLRAQQGNAGAIQVVTALGALASVAAGSVTDPRIQAGAALAAGALKIAADALAGRLDPAQINLDQLFVKSPTQLLAEAGITPDDIAQAIAGRPTRTTPRAVMPATASARPRSGRKTGGRAGGAASTRGKARGRQR